MSFLRTSVRRLSRPRRALSRARDICSRAVERHALDAFFLGLLRNALADELCGLAVAAALELARTSFSSEEALAITLSPAGEVIWA